MPAPPPEKKYWWPLPRHEDPRASEFRSYDQFERIAWHWAEINASDPRSRWMHFRTHRQFFVRLEDLVVSPRFVKGLLDFLNLSYRHEHFEIFARPHNVNRPEDRPLTEAQRETFYAIAAPMMEQTRLRRTRRIRSELLTLSGERWLPDSSGGLPCAICANCAVTMRFGAIYTPERSTRGISVHLCDHCGLLQSLPRIDRAERAPASVSSGADWGNVRYGKGFRTQIALDALARHADLNDEIALLDVGSNRGSFVADISGSGAERQHRRGRAG